MSTKHLQDLHNSNSQIYKLMEPFSQIAIRYLTHIILNKNKIMKKKKKASPGPTWPNNYSLSLKLKN